MSIYQTSTCKGNLILWSPPEVTLGNSRPKSSDRLKCIQQDNKYTGQHSVRVSPFKKTISSTIVNVFQNEEK